MQNRQDKSYSSDSTSTKSDESTSKATSNKAASTRMPAWTSAWGDRPPVSLTGPLTDLQAKHIVNQPGDAYEQEADDVADQVMRSNTPGSSMISAPPGTSGVSSLVATSLSRVSPMIQRAPLDEQSTATSATTEASTPTSDTAATESTSTSDTTTAGAAPESTVPAVTSTPGLIVEDDADQLGPGQMKKSDFLSQLYAAVSSVAGNNASMINDWFDYYSRRSSQDIEQAIRMYIPEAAQVTTAMGYIPLVQERVRQSAGTGAEGGGMSSTPASVATGGAETASAEANNAMLKGREGSSTASTPHVIQGQLGAGRQLEGGVKSRMESAFGMDFSHVRMHTDTRAEGLSNNLNARAFTVGEHVAFGSGEYQPGSLIGDALIAHELAHVVQQRGTNQAQSVQQNGGTSYNSLEEDADMSAVGAVASLWGGAKGMLVGIAQNALPNLRSGLRLQRCGPSLLEKLQKIQDARELHNNLDSLKDEDLDKLQKDAPAGTLLSKGILWEKAFRKKDWASLAKNSQTDKEGFYEAYNYQIVDQIMAGQTNIKVESSFADWVRNQFIELVSKPVGFRLVIELLATGQTTNITKTPGAQTTERIFSEQNPDAGRFITRDAEGKPLPLEQQRRGSPAGSNIAFNPDLVENQVTLGKTDGNLSIIKTESAVTFGHELIHALHNARGENIAPPPFAEKAHEFLGSENYYVREAATGRAESAEELRTTTGQTSFQAPSSVKGPITWALAYNLPSQDNITENMLRSERNLPERVSHIGATRAYRVKVLTSQTVDQMLNRYSMKDGRAVPPEIKAILKEVFLSFNPVFNGQDSLSAEAQKALKEIPVEFPHLQYLPIYLAYVKKQEKLADSVTGLQFREGP